tara:strand:+ start:134 stop:430 length:297 start_codon:yes stop_codon:yes gene_type:complete
MSAITNFSINLEAIDKSKIIKGKNGSYVNLTMFQNDDTRYGNNASITLAQTKEERDAKESKQYIGNGKVTWVAEEGITVAEREDAPAETESVSDGLPF